ncbi:MAG TPA: elongation factor G [Gemmataceae bacterium]|nr:elongation factor G [Gemmataceae bacterium]
MAVPTTDDLKLVRNIGVIAHIDAGKTTTTEHLLYYAGAKHKLGGVDEGTTETDYDPEEQERGITIYSACVPFQWMGHTINLIDTPGHVDFTAEVERSLRVLDGAVCVFDAQKGVEAQSETVWRQANKYNVPRLVFVNKMDVVGANYAHCVEEIRHRLQGAPLPIVIPIGAGSIKETNTPFVGVIDVLTMKALYFDAGDYGKTVREADIPADNLDEARNYREQLFDVLTRHDEQDKVTSLYLDGKDVPIATVRALIREQTVRRLVQPVLCGSGREHAGIQPLLDGVCHYLPSPLDRPPVVGINPKKQKEEKRKPDFKDPFCGLVFKVIAQDTGDLFYIRVYSGVLKANSRVYNPGKDVKENIGKLYHIHADPTQRDELPQTHAGDIVAVIGLKDSVTGDTLCETQHPILLEPITFAETVVSQRIEPESGADKDKLTGVLNKLQREDPTFVVKTDKDTGQMVMNGMGTLHLEVKRHRMERDFRLKIRVYKPQVSYRETLRGPVTVEGECDRMIGGKNVFARVKVEFTARKSEQPVTVTSRLKPNAIPAPFPDVIVRALRSALQSGGLGFPVMDVHATVVDATFDAERSTEPAFEAAAADAVAKAFSRENMRLLEPVMRLSVTVPTESSGNVFAYLMARRGEIDRQDSDGRLVEIGARVPLVNMFDYADELRSLTQGRASSTLEPHSYAPAPDEVLRSFLEG